MSRERFPVLWLGRVAVVSLPVEIDLSNADQIREDLLSVVNRGAATLIVDMSGTTFCDSAGVNALVRTLTRATASGTGMRLVVSSHPVRRVLDITGVDHLIDVYPSVAASLASADQEHLDGKPLNGRTAVQTDPDGWAAQPG
ncbi:MAG TPA: STAS domain-containing protein [Streptosporangiaceae bacterium]